MLLGKVKAVGKEFPNPVPVGTRIATLVSLSLTPLKIDKIEAIHMDKDQVDIQGHAILFASGIF
jgi:L-erythro-3,5-diaminohexanoate dehydrogenase